jgi:wyosine [tRNA(Phe)-imidazoG37] synthetase (radical SAM superfamily)
LTKRKGQKELDTNANEFFNGKGIIPLQSGYVYGPINSRRLGNSLGINPFPLERKICTFNCIYCQYGWTNKNKFSIERLAGLFPSIEKIKNALEVRMENLRSADIDVNYVTFAGNGEPTLHPEFSDLVDMASGLRDQYFPEAQTAVLSNSTTVMKQEVRKGLDKLDRRIMKLDVGSQEQLDEINAPIVDITFNEMVEGLKSLKSCTIQSLFIMGRVTNASGKALQDWIDTIDDIKPEFVQIYSIDRVPADRGLEIVSWKQLIEISTSLKKKNGIKAEAY